MFKFPTEHIRMRLMNLVYPCSRQQGLFLGFRMILKFLLACRLAYNSEHRPDGIQEGEEASTPSQKTYLSLCSQA